MLAHRIIEWLWWSKQQSIWSFLPFFSKLKAKLKREQFEKEKRRLACRARRAPKQKRLEREEKKLKGNMSLPVNLSSDFQRSLVSFTTCWHCFPPPPLCPLEVERLGKKPAWILKSFWSHHSKVTKTIVGLQTDTIFCQRKLPLLNPSALNLFQNTPKIHYLVQISIVRFCILWNLFKPHYSSSINAICKFFLFGIVRMYLELALSAILVFDTFRHYWRTYCNNEM